MAFELTEGLHGKLHSGPSPIHFSQSSAILSWEVRSTTGDPISSGNNPCYKGLHRRFGEGSAGEADLRLEVEQKAALTWISFMGLIRREMACFFPERLFTVSYSTSSCGWAAYTPSRIFVNCSVTSTFCSRDKWTLVRMRPMCHLPVQPDHSLLRSEALSFPVCLAPRLLDWDSSDALELVDCLWVSYMTVARCVC